jgi:ribosome-associated protein
MDDMLPADNIVVNSPLADSLTQTAVELGSLLAEHKGNDVVILDLRGLDAWTDFFVIAGVTSGTHMSGLERQVKEFAQDKGIEILRKSAKKAAIDEEWKLIDLGTLVVHLMTEKARSFYELERLWSQAKTVTPKAD